MCQPISIRQFSVAIQHDTPIEYYVKKDQAIKNICQIEGMDENEYLPVPKKSRLVTLKGFINYYTIYLVKMHPHFSEKFKKHIDDNLANFQAYNIHEQRHLIDAMLDQFPNAHHEYNKYTDIAAVDFVMQWCEQNDILYDMKEMWRCI